MIIITRVINIIGKLSTHKRHYTVIPCVCKKMLFIKKKKGGLNIFVFDINVEFKKKTRKLSSLCLAPFGSKGNGISDISASMR